MDDKRLEHLIYSQTPDPEQLRHFDTLDQAERHHAEQLAESRRHSRRAEVVSWSAVAISIAALVLPFVLRDRSQPSPNATIPVVAPPSPTTPAATRSTQSKPIDASAPVALPASSPPATGTSTPTATPAAKQP